MVPARPALLEVVRWASEGDEAAFALIVDAHDSELYRICVAISRDETIAADAVQVAWSIAWRRLATLRDPSRLRPWLIAIAVNEARSMLRRQHRRRVAETADDTSQRSRDLDPATGVSALDLRLALERLLPDDRALLVLRHVAGFNATELAQVLGMSSSGVRTKLERLTARIRQELEHG